MRKVIIVNYGMGNLRSVEKALSRINIISETTSDPEKLLTAEFIVLPGVGHFRRGMENLKSAGLDAALKSAVLSEKIPLLGICLGMQLLTRHSEEGDCEGLGLIEGVTKKFIPVSETMKIPHIGWNNVSFKGAGWFGNVNAGTALYYFVHSYYVEISGRNVDVAITRYGTDFVSAIRKDNVFGVQFHPEKSHSAGLTVLRDFFQAYVQA